MKEMDLVIFTENSGAIVETLFSEKPLLWLSYLCPKKDDNVIYHEFFNENIQKVDSCSPLLEHINKILSNKQMLKNVLKKQKNAIPKVLSFTGIEAAEKLALACDTLIQF